MTQENEKRFVFHRAMHCSACGHRYEAGATAPMRGEGFDTEVMCSDGCRAWGRGFMQDALRGLPLLRLGLCPKCEAASAIERANVLIKTGIETKEREAGYARAVGLLETVLEHILGERLLLCSTHAAEFFRQHALATAAAELGLVGSVERMLKP